jgi:hypothetical protein
VRTADSGAHTARASIARRHAGRFRKLEGTIRA